MKKLIIVTLLLACCLNLCSAAASETTATNETTTTTTAPAAPALAVPLPDEYAIVKRSYPEGGYKEYQSFTNADDVRKINSVLPNYEGGKDVTAELTGTPIKVRTVKGTKMLPYEVYPNDLVVWWYDLKCATVKGAYATLSGMLESAPKATEQPRIEAREYGGIGPGDHFLNYLFLTDAITAQPFVNGLETMKPIEKLNSSPVVGGLIINLELIRGLKSEYFYLYDYGYAQNQSTDQLYRVNYRDMEAMFAEMKFTPDAPTAVRLAWWPTSAEFVQRRTFSPTTAQAPSNTNASYIESLALLEEKAATDAPETKPDTAPLYVSVWSASKLTTRYDLYDNDLLHDLTTNRWYTVADGTFGTLKGLGW